MTLCRANWFENYVKRLFVKALKKKSKIYCARRNTSGKVRTLHIGDNLKIAFN